MHLLCNIYTVERINIFCVRTRVYSVETRLLCRTFPSQRVRITYNHYIVTCGYSAMDSKDTTSADLPLAQEGTGGHEMWPIDDDCIIIGENGRDELTLYFNLRNGVCSTTVNAALAYTEDMFASQDPDLGASGPDDLQEYMSETQDIEFNAIGVNETPQDMSQTPDLYFDEDDGPEPTNRMEDHPIPPELQCETKSKYDELTPCTSDDDIISPVISAARRVIVPIRTPRPIPKFCELLDRLTPEEIESEDYIYEDMPYFEDSVHKKPFTCTTSTDEDSDAEYSEHPFNSNTSTTNDSNNGNNSYLF